MQRSLGEEMANKVCCQWHIKAADENNHDAKKICEQFKQCITLIDDGSVITDKTVSNIIQLSQGFEQ